MTALERRAVALLVLLALAAPYPMVRWREQIAAVIGVGAVGLVLLAAVLGCVWLAGRLTARPPMTEHLRPSDDERRLLERLR